MGFSTKQQSGSDGVGAGGELTSAEEAWVQTGAAVTSTDNAVVRFSGTDAALQNSGVTISDTDVMLVPSLTASEILITDASKNIVSAAVATYPSLAELIHVKGVTSAIQTQLNAKAATSHTHTKTDLTDIADFLLESEVDADIKTLSLPASTTITAAAATVLDDATVGAMVDTLGGATSTGTGGLVRATSPTLITPALGTPASGVMTNVTGLPTAGLVDDAVTLAKMAAGTAGNLITYDASGNPAAVATGTATHVLTSNGAGAAPTFQAAAGGGEKAIGMFPGDGFVNGATVEFNASGFTIWRFRDLQSDAVAVMCRVPDGADGLALNKVEILYIDDSATTKNIIFDVEMTVFDYSAGGALVQDTTETDTTHATLGSMTTVGIIVAPADSFNALPATVAKGDILGITFRRLGNEVADTYSADLRVLGIIATFV